MALRDYLKYRGNSLPSLDIPQASLQLASVCKEIVQNSQAVRIFPLAEQSIANIYAELCHCAWGGRSFTSLAQKTLILAPWVFYYGERHLGESPEFIAQYFTWLSGISPSRQARVLAVLWYVLIQYYPKDSNTFSELCRRMVGMLATCLKIKVKNIYLACEEHNLLHSDGVEKLAEDMMAHGIHMACTKRRLPAELSSSQFVRHGCRYALHSLQERLSTPDAMPSLTAFIRCYEQEAGSESLFGKEATINALLVPFATVQRSEVAYKNTIQNFLLRHFKDPRLDKRHWLGVDPIALSVMERWLVATQLQDFFGILRDTAEPAWQARQFFWSRYLDKGVIKKAWVVLGRDARRAATHTELPKNSFADLSGAASAQSVLLMQIDTLIIIEWTHSGACRFCDEEDAAAPKFYMDTYFAYDLRITDSSPIRHAGRWQQAIASRIDERTGIRWS